MSPGHQVALQRAFARVQGMGDFGALRLAPQAAWTMRSRIRLAVELPFSRPMHSFR